MTLTPSLAATLTLGIICLFLVLTGAANLVLLFRGAIEARQWRTATADPSGKTLLTSPLFPAIAVIAAPLDASAESRSQIRRMLKLEPGSVGVVLVLDAPSGSDLALWMEEFHLEPSRRLSGSFLTTRPVRAVYESRDPIRLLVVSSDGDGGEAGRLNTGVNFANAPIIAVVDAGAQVSEDVLLWLAQPMIADPDHTVAVCAAAPVAAVPGLIARLSYLEFWRMWLGRCALSAWGAALPAPIGFSLFNRDALIRAGGFDAGSAELVTRLQGLARTGATPDRVRFLPVPAGRPRAPQSSESGALSSKERCETRNALSHSGSPGWLAIPELTGVHSLRPMIEIGGLTLAVAALALHWISPVVFSLLTAGTIGFGVLLSMSVVLLTEFAAETRAEPGDLAALFLSAVPENIGYRQCHDLWTIDKAARKRHRPASAPPPP